MLWENLAMGTWVLWVYMALVTEDSGNTDLSEYMKSRNLGTYGTGKIKPRKNKILGR